MQRIASIACGCLGSYRTGIQATVGAHTDLYDIG